MKKIKTATFIILLFLSISIYAQSKDSLSIKHDMFKYSSLTIDNNKNYYKNIQEIEKIHFKKRIFQFNIYNEDTGLNDTYLMTKNGSNLIYSSKLLENNFSLHKIDSFNPYGSPDIGTAIFNGLLNSLLNSN